MEGLAADAVTDACHTSAPARTDDASVDVEVDAYGEVANAYRHATLSNCHALEPPLLDPRVAGGALVDLGGGCWCLPAFLASDEQVALAEQVLQQWIEPPNRTNLEVSEDAACLSRLWDQYTQGLRELRPTGLHALRLRKLRWSCIGAYYDWTARAYRPNEASHVPPLLEGACRGALRAAGLPSSTSAWRPESSLINFYHAHRSSDRLGGHRDDVEESDQSPLVCISLGSPSAIFLLGGVRRDVQPTPILLRGGDVVIMSGASRQFYHGIPTLLVDDSGGHKRTKSHQVPSPTVEDFLLRTRVSLSTREVWRRQDGST
mmetsp:Transcript_45078/g.124935  ORF Transcript_45078/g.124935 Transcript_45078/m.124935 type:complete len:318 (-) Transcript_45078:25-978(-)